MSTEIDHTRCQARDSKSRRCPNPATRLMLRSYGVRLACEDHASGWTDFPHHVELDPAKLSNAFLAVYLTQTTETRKRAERAHASAVRDLMKAVAAEAEALDAQKARKP